jgi:hypothetical protein
MDNNRKDILIELSASLLGLALVLHTLVNMQNATTLRWVTTIAGVGVFLFGCLRYGRRYRQLQKQSARLPKGKDA